MIRIISIWLCLTLLFQSGNFGLYDVLRMGELIEHARFHSHQYGDSFFTFLSKHYGSLKKDHEQHHKEEQKDHERLPFNHSFSAHAITFFVVNRHEIPLKKLEPLTDTDVNFFYGDHYSFMNWSKVFQPPKHA
ncbi:hypothetical protein [Ascidiimonas aurantiaca]|uniref:hypothetical protein n=1 Tax=Ascidiimonas aurantiaca TaxID=1685432 RepID=UPI0030EEA088